MIRFRSLLRSTRGNATIEFAFCSLFLFATMMVGLDFAFYAQQKMRLGSAVEEGAILAYNTQVGGTTSTVSNFVRAAAKTSATPTVAITCNGTSTCGDGKCSCLSGSGGFVATNTCNSACPGSASISGNYMKIAATVAYRSVVVPDRWLGGHNLTQSAVVRLQ